MSAETKLRSDGFGRIEQRIVFSIPAGQEENLPSDLDISSLETTTSPPRSFYLWRRWSVRLGDDEDIVRELSSVIGLTHVWEIAWERSAF
jgi:hypothetical protein